VPLSRNLGALTSWNPLGLSRLVMGLLYLYLFLQIHTNSISNNASRDLTLIIMTVARCVGTGSTGSSSIILTKQYPFN